MKERDFPEEKIEAGGQRVIAAKIECSGCAAVGYYPRKRGAARRPPAAIAAHFRAQGWNLRGAKVRCPECARRRPRAEEKGQGMVKAVQKQASPVAFGVPVDPASVAGSVVLLPAAAALEDKQLINMKLMEVYDNPAVGYRPGWSDTIVARDLGVRKDWVAEVRDLMFGPPGSSPQLDAFFEGVSAVEKRAAEVLADQVAACRRVDAVSAEVGKIAADLRISFAGLRDMISALQKQGDAIKAGMGR